ncbi:MAG TPA: VWA domain-containing protein, partial [Solirubrobacteraceae bacterium]|nr:VWA domain-containing protein [Solirubrobacteraceae bacterium]
MSSTPTPNLPPATPGGLAGSLLSFADDLRSEGLAVGTSEILDAFQALEHVPWTAQEDFKEAMAATLAKSPEDRRVFELVFDRFFFRAAEAEAARRRISEGTGDPEDGAAELNLDTLRQQIAAALRDGSDAAMRDLARLAIAAFGQGEGSGVLGVDVQRIRRALGLRAEPQPDLPEDDPRREGIPRDQLRRFEQHLRRELERAMIERTSSLPPKRPLNELDRALPTGPIQDLAAVHRVVTQLKRRLATQGQEMRGRKRHAHVDVRRTMRASLETGGVPVKLKFRPQRPRRPEIFVLCDVST